MEEQALLLRENLLNIRSIVTNNKVKIDKLRYKNLVTEQETARIKKIKMKEKMMETPRNIDRSLRGGNKRSAVKSASKSGIGNALGLLTIIVIASNFDNIKNLVTNFIKGDTFKSIAQVFTNIKDFFVKLFKGFNETQQLFGEKYRQFIAFKDEKLEDIEKITEKFKEIGEKFKELRNFAIELKNKFDNLLLGTRGNIPIEQEKTGLEKYGYNDEDYDLIMGDDGNYRVVPKGNDETSNKNASNLGLTDYSNVTDSTNNLKKNIVPFNNVEPTNSQYNFAQYTDDDKKRDVVLITRTNTVIT